MEIERQRRKTVEREYEQKLREMRKETRDKTKLLGETSYCSRILQNIFTCTAISQSLCNQVRVSTVL